MQVNRYIRISGLLALCTLLISCQSPNLYNVNKVSKQPPLIATDVTEIEASKKDTVIVEIPKPIALPGQMSKIPNSEKIEAKPEKANDKAVLKEANSVGMQTASLDGFFNAMMLFEYTDGALYKIYAAPQRITDIQFQTGEKVREIAAGETVRWQVVSASSGVGDTKIQHLLVKPKRSGLVNSMVVTTNRRTYHMLLESLQSDYMASVRWNYPRMILQKMEEELKMEEQRSKDIVSENIEPESLNFKYVIELAAGYQPGWMPRMVFDDGKKTYIQFSEDFLFREAPVLLIYSDGDTRIVNYRVKGNYYVVDRLFDRAELRSGTKKPTVVRLLRNGFRYATNMPTDK